MKQGKPNGFVRAFVQVTGFVPTRIFLRPKLYYMNKESQGKKLPKPCILMSNHKSLMDFVLYMNIFPFRTLRFLIAEVMFNKGKMFSKFLFSIGGILVNRDTRDFSFVGESLKVLDKGGTIGIFPEGRLPVNGQPWPFKPSVVFIALRTDAPIVPMYTDGAYSFKKRARVMIGEKIYIRDYCKEENPSPEEITRLTQLLEDKTNELRLELERRVETENGKK
ncbi:MAG: 1-acyl-sn-glycerol-3-phosphate acyltransferase [Clostridia bacterium]|nr:1-acyl-sn-glycerol-3-phosphate acyltransferase [Clostridia bacterium]